MARLNARWFNFSRRGKAWTQFWQDTAAFSPDVTVQVTGVAGTGTAGMVALATDQVFPISGVAGTGAAGDPALTGTALVILEGSAAAGQAGEVIAFGDAVVGLAGVEATGAVGAATVQIEDAAAPAPEAPRGGATITVLVPKKKRPTQVWHERAAVTGVRGLGAAGQVSVLTRDWVEDDEIMLRWLVA